MLCQAWARHGATVLSSGKAWRMRHLRMSCASFGCPSWARQPLRTVRYSPRGTFVRRQQPCRSSMSWLPDQTSLSAVPRYACQEALALQELHVADARSDQPCSSSALRVSHLRPLVACSTSPHTYGTKNDSAPCSSS